LKSVPSAIPAFLEISLVVVASSPFWRNSAKAASKMRSLVCSFFLSRLPRARARGREFDFREDLFRAFFIYLSALIFNFRQRSCQQKSEYTHLWRTKKTCRGMSDSGTGVEAFVPRSVRHCRMRGRHVPAPLGLGRGFLRQFLRSGVCGMEAGKQSLELGLLRFDFGSQAAAGGGVASNFRLSRFELCFCLGA